MKKFRFSLDSVMRYKQQMLETCQAEYGAELVQVRQQEEILGALKLRWQAFRMEYQERQDAGMTVADAMAGQNALHVLDGEIRKETERLEKLRQRAEQKRLEMVEAKKETATIEKLREKKLDSYQKDVQKREEAFVDEFVSVSRAVSK